MVLPFCPQCRATVSIQRSGAIRCPCCPYESHLSQLDPADIPSITTVSQPTPMPTWAKSDEEQARLRQAAQMPTRATVEEACVKCDHPEVYFNTAQLRSVDEGQTVFYTCPKCNHNWSTNN